MNKTQFDAIYFLVSLSVRTLNGYKAEGSDLVDYCIVALSVTRSVN